MSGTTPTGPSHVPDIDTANGAIIGTFSGGQHHPHTLASADTLANCLYTLGEYQRARDLGEDTLTRRRRVLGPDHPRTLDTAHNLTLVLRDMGRHRQARKLEKWIKSRDSS